MVPLPQLDDRTPEQFAAKVRELLARNPPRRRPQSPIRGESGEALVRIFEHFCSILVDRLNQAPYKNFLSFLDLQGVSPRPARAARVPLTFQLAAQHAGYVKVPARTQVAAALEPGEQKPVIFETEREFTVAPAKLASVATKDGSLDRFSDYSSLLQTSVTRAAPVFRAATPTEHCLYIGLDLPLAVSALKELRLSLQVVPAKETGAKSWFEWQMAAGGQEPPVGITPVKDETNGFRGSGDITFDSLPDAPSTDLLGVKARWMICRLKLPLGNGPESMSPAGVPSLKGVQVTTVFAREGLPPDAAFANQSGLDITKDFFPFGERPKFGDTFYLAAAQAFMRSGTAVTLRFNMTNAETEAAGTSPPQVHAYAVKLQWELGDGKNWIELGTSESGREMHEEATGFADTTRAFTHSGTVAFRVPKNAAFTTVGGIAGGWLRVRMVSGDYGRDTHYEKSPDGGVTVVPAAFTPPGLHSVSIDYTLQTTSAPLAVVAYNDFTYSHVDWGSGPVPLFRAPVDPLAWCYLGFIGPNRFSGGSMNIYVGIANAGNGGRVSEISGPDPVIVWEYWSGADWKRLPMQDGTGGLTRSGIISFLPPPDFSAKQEFGKEMHWARFRTRDKTQYEPWINRMALNTIMASQSISIFAEVLGTSVGVAGQKFLTTRSPVLEGQQVEVREPIMPLLEEKKAIMRAEGAGSLREAEVFRGYERPGEVWVRWHEVPDFEASTGNDRHYTIDRTAGQITFGDGVKGRIPPPLNQNVSMAQYRTGGGAIGNRKANSITQLKNAVAYIEKVTNLEPASGGADVETHNSMLRRSPRQIRHGWRAVTPEDFEDLAILASPDVARARCLPMRDLSTGPELAWQRPGVVSLIIVPGLSASASNAPTPSIELLGQVRDFLDAHRPAEADLVITGPDYVSIKVETEITISADATPGDVESAARKAITQFLHPVTGNRDGHGWDFGQEPTRSDFFPLLEVVPGVEHVRELQIARTNSPTEADISDHFLICAAEPQVTATWET